MEEKIYCALLALGFSPSCISQKERIHIDENIFKRMNQKVGDYILHFLYSQINSQQAAELFRDCWPIYDKKLESQFRNVAFDWFKKLNQSEEFNIKPCLVVSKAVVTPTSNKFLLTCYTLCRFALHSQIMKKDPSCTILLPLSIYKPEQYQNTVPLIIKLKLHHRNKYLNAVRESANLLQSLQSTAKDLVSKYRSTVKTKMSLQEEFEQKLQNCSHLSNGEKEVLSGCLLNQLEEDLTKRTKDKNNEICALWAKASMFEDIDRKSRWKFSNVIRGEKCHSYIDGEDYFALNHKTHEDFPFVQNVDTELCHREGKLDVVSVLQTSNLALNNLHSLTRESFHASFDVKGQSKESEHQSNCVQVLKKDTREIQDLLNSCLSSFLESIIELRGKLENKSQISPQFKPGHFELCPPTPHLNVERNSSYSISLQPQYHMINLTPSSAAKRSQGLLNSSVLQEKSSKHSRLQKRRIENEFSSPQLKNSVSNLSNASSMQLTVDSGCVMSCGTDTLLQSLERLNVTPKRVKRLSSAHRNSLNLSSSYLPNTSLKARVNKNKISLGISDKDNTSLNKNNNSLNNNRTRINSQKYENSYNCFNETSPDDSVLGNRFYLSKKENEITHCSDVANATGSHTPKFNIKHSPIISQLLKEIKADEEKPTAENKFQTFVRRFKNAKENLSINAQTLNSSSQGSMNKKNISRHQMSILTSESSEPKESLENDVRTEASKTFLSCLSSLESWLDDDKEKVPYQFTESIESNKFPKDHCDEQDGFETFEDGKSFLDKMEQLPKRRDSIFQTITEAVISGELQSDLILNENVNSQARRESLNISLGESVIQRSRRQSNGVPTISNFANRLSIEGTSLFDESDSCLLSTSTDVF